MRRFSNITPAHEHEVETWIMASLDLTPQQKLRLLNEDIVRLSPFYFYKLQTQKQTSLLWRLTALFLPIYFAILFLYMFVKYILTGSGRLKAESLDGCFGWWLRKIGM